MQRSCDVKPWLLRRIKMFKTESKEIKFSARTYKIFGGIYDLTVDRNNISSRLEGFMLHKIIDQ